MFSGMLSFLNSEKAKRDYEAKHGSPDVAIPNGEKGMNFWSAPCLFPARDAWSKIFEMDPIHEVD